LDATDGDDLVNYVVKYGDDAKTVEKVTLSADKKTATLTMAADSEMAQQTKVSVTVKKKAGGYPADVVATPIASASDLIVPTVGELTITGPDTLTITIDEPVQEDAGMDDFVVINNGAVGVDVTLNATKRVVQIKTGEKLNDGETYVVQIKNFKDFAGLKIVSKKWESFVFVKDTSAPTASLKSAKQLKVVVKFDRAVGINGTTTPLDKRYFYHTYATWNPDTVTPNKTKNATEYTLTFDNNSLQPGDVVVTVLKTKGTDLDVKDAWGNKMAADAKLATTIVADVTPPEMDGVTYKKQDKETTTLEISVSEKVEGFTHGDLVVLDSDGDEVSASKPAKNNLEEKADSNGLVYTYTFGKSLSGGNYKLKLKANAVTDKDNKVANKNAETIIPFTVTDKLAPEVSDAVYIQDDGVTKADTIFVTYSEKMNQATDGGGVLNKANYRFKDAALGTNDKVEAFGTSGKMVKITIADPATPAVIGINDLDIDRVEDAAGNKTVAFQTTPDLEEAQAPTILTVKFTATNKVDIEFDMLISTPKASEIAVTVSGDVYALSTIGTLTEVKASGAKKVRNVLVGATLNAKGKLASEDDSFMVPTNTSVTVKMGLDSNIGKKVATDTVVSGADVMIDKLRPSLNNINLERKTATVAVVTVNYKETLHTDPKLGSGNDVLAEDYSIKVGDKTYIANDDFTAVVSGMSVVLTITEDKEADFDDVIGQKFVVTSTGVKYVQDKSGNLVKEFEDKETVDKMEDN
jgi:hypothetical protein